MSPSSAPGGAWTLGDLEVSRLGFGAMQLAGRGVIGPPADHYGALAVLRETVEPGLSHIDTSDAYGPHIRSGAGAQRPSGQRRQR
jgi:aryl-alcohol dehydrogenase-like predicted oxidoreductase